MRNIYMLQTNIIYPNGTYLPYATGAIAAYSFADEEISREFCLKEIFCIREKSLDIINRLDNPKVFSFSCYVWNTEYNKDIARRVKELFPDCVTVFGGHNIPENSKSFLEENSFADIVIFGEGERPFKGILEHLLGKAELCDIDGIAYRESGNIILTKKAEPGDVSDYPSPYAMGLFDGILEKYKDIDFSAIVETNRGCPYHCAFCDWCEQQSKIRSFTWERIKDDIRWMAEKKIEFCYCADANFGIFQRDENLIDYLIENKKEYGYPKKFRVNFAKHNNETVFKITQKLEEAGLNKGATISFQSMNEQTLKSIGRENMPIERFSELMELYRQAGISTYTEIILGLPGENYDDFCSGIGRLLEAGQHTTLFIYNCELLINSAMASPEYKRRYSIKSAETPLYLRHNARLDDTVPEQSRSVTSTDKMDTDDWVKANMFSMLIQSCHSLGLLRFFALFLFDRHGIKYEDFYNEILAFAVDSPDTVIGTVYEEFKKCFYEIADGCGEWSYVVPEAGDVAWPYEEAFYIKLLLKKEIFYDEITVFLKKYSIDTQLFDDIFNYQKAIVKEPGKQFCEAEFEYDVVPYFSDIMCHHKTELMKRKNRIVFYDSENYDNISDFAKHCIWFGRSTQKNLFSDISVEYGG